MNNRLNFPVGCPGLVRKWTIREGLAAKTLYNAGLLDEFANSFVVVAGTEGAESRFGNLFAPTWKAKRMSVRGRNRRHHRATTLTRNGDHLAVIKAAVEYGATRDPAAAVAVPWTPGDLLLVEVSRGMLGADPDASVYALLDEYHRASLEEFATSASDAGGYPLLQGRCIDFLTRSITCGPNGLVAIDLEWEPPEAVPIDFMLFRSMWNDVIAPNHAWAVRRIAASTCTSSAPFNDSPRHTDSPGRPRTGRVNTGSWLASVRAPRIDVAPTRPTGWPPRPGGGCFPNESGKGSGTPN